ncbi:MAG: arsenate reductase ArsC [Ardenticatenales bacterium]|nr:arsenate reductase ArsC [Ardenticatenales bacterium]
MSQPSPSPSPSPSPASVARTSAPSLDEIPLEFRPLLRSAAQRLTAEFASYFSAETIERFLDESLDEILARARVRAFIPLFAERFAHDRLWSLAKAEGKLITDMPVVLFLCVHNAGRSQMAAGWLDHLAGDRVKVMSGGSVPDGEVNENAVAAMKERGIDIGKQFPKPWTDEVVQAADVVITMGCGDACPIYPGKKYEDWVVDDPAGVGLDAVRAIRDDLEQRVKVLLTHLDTR